MNSQNIYSLSVILNRVQEILDQRLKGVHFWLKVEIATFRKDQKGHCYLELVETNQQQVIARSRAIIWNHTMRTIEQNLGHDTSAILKEGSEILCFCEIQFSPAFGLSIHIDQVDLNFSMGELERKKQQTLKKLEEEGLIHLNKAIIIPQVIQRIALIASPNTAGYEDFVKQLTTNRYQLYYQIDLYPCVVQGDQAATSIIHQMGRLKATAYDVIVLIRGGGSKFDLEPFNDFHLAVAIATSKCPVFTGIGHEIDVSVADTVAHTFFKTPSAVGAHLVEHNYHFWVTVSTCYAHIQKTYEQKMIHHQKDLQLVVNEIASQAISKTQLKRGNLHTTSNRFITQVSRRIAKENSHLNLAIAAVQSLPNAFTQQNHVQINERATIIQMIGKNKLRDEYIHLEAYTNHVILSAKNTIRHQRMRMQNMEAIPPIYHPDQTLKRGYALVRKDHQLIRGHENLKEGDRLEIQFYQTTLTVTITQNINPWKTIPTRVHPKN